MKCLTDLCLTRVSSRVRVSTLSIPPKHHPPKVSERAKFASARAYCKLKKLRNTGTVDTVQMDQQGIYTAPGLSREWGSLAHFAPRVFRARAGSAPPLQSYTADAFDASLLRN